jgi:hypothetical protein
MGSKVGIPEWDNNQSLKSLQVRYTDVLGRFLAGPEGSDREKPSENILLNQVVFEDFLLFFRQFVHTLPYRSNIKLYFLPAVLTIFFFNTFLLLLLVSLSKPSNFLKYFP